MRYIIKNFKHLTIAFLTIGLLGCNFGDKNVDPNKITPDKLLVQDLLQGIELNFANLLASDVPRSVSNTMGQIQNQTNDIGFNSYLYSPNSGAIRGMWSNIYSGVLFSCDNAYKRAKAQNANYYKGIINIIKAVTIAHATDVWGDVPYKQLFDLDNYPNPAFDSQESVYTEIQLLLDQAILDLTPAGNLPLPSVDDKIFSGDKNKWIRTAYGLKARYYLHLSRKNVAYYTLAEEALQKALVDSTDNCVYKFDGGIASLNHPIYNQKVGTQIYTVDSSFVKMLQDLNDPRLDFYAYAVFDLQTGQNIITFGPFYSQATSYIPIITYEECMFMKAEIELNKGNKPLASQYLTSAIKSSLDRICSISINPGQAGGATAVNVAARLTYANSQGDIDNTSVTTDQAWNRLFTQKYISQFLSLETWNDYRRSSKYVSSLDGLPNITPRVNSTIPRRYPYSFDEISYNSNTPREPGIFARNWWDAP